MRLSLLALAVFAHEGHDEEEENQDFGDVVQLTDANFKEFIQENPLTLVKFYAPWCGHCKQMKPAYIEAASLLLKEKIPIAELDCIAQAETCKVYNVQGFPSLKIFRNGSESEYKGQRSAESIVSTMKKQLLPAITPLPNVEKAEAFLSAHKVAVVGFFDASNKKEQDGFKTIAEQVFRDDFTFASSNDVKVLKHYGVKAPAVVLFKDFDEKKSVYSGDYSKKSLSDFVMTYSMRIMGEITPENYEMYAKRGLPIGFFFYGSEEHKTKYGPILEKFAKKYRKTVSFVYLDASAHGGHADNLALKQTWPAFGIQDEAKRTKYPFDQSLELNEANFGEWITSYADGTLAPAIKSEEIPESNDGPVKVLVGKQFNDIVLDKSKDVFIKFYAPWCGHCKALAPVWEQLGESISSEHVVIAKMDHTANDFADVQIDIQGYPTLALVTAKDNKVVMYEGDRSLKSFQAFLKQNASNGKDIKVEETEETDSEEPERLFTVDDDDEAAKIDDDDADRDEL